MDLLLMPSSKSVQSDFLTMFAENIAFVRMDPDTVDNDTMPVLHRTLNEC